MIVVNIKRIVTRLFDQIVHDDLLLYFSATRDRDAYHLRQYSSDAFWFE
jgi:hypothetical protein